MVPTHVLGVKRKGDNFGTRVGAGWVNDKGWISVKLNPCVVLSHTDDVYITLFPARKEKTVESTEPPAYLDEAPPWECEEV